MSRRGSHGNPTWPNVAALLRQLARSGKGMTATECLLNLGVFNMDAAMRQVRRYAPDAGCFHERLIHLEDQWKRLGIAMRPGMHRDSIAGIEITEYLYIPKGVQ